MGVQIEQGDGSGAGFGEYRKAGSAVSTRTGVRVDTVLVAKKTAFSATLNRVETSRSPRYGFEATAALVQGAGLARYGGDLARGLISIGAGPEMALFCQSPKPI